MLPIPGTASVEHLEENVAAAELEARAAGARPAGERGVMTDKQGVNEPPCSRDPAHVASTTSPFGLTREPLAEFLCDQLGMHVIEETDTFTLAGVDAKLGKLTLFDAEGPRERGALERIALRVGNLDAWWTAASGAGVEPDAHGVASFEAPGGVPLALVERRRAGLRPRPRACCDCPTRRRAGRAVGHGLRAPRRRVGR